MTLFIDDIIMCHFYVTYFSVNIYIYLIIVSKIVLIFNYFFTLFSYILK